MALRQAIYRRCGRLGQQFSSSFLLLARPRPHPLRSVPARSFMPLRKLFSSLAARLASGQRPRSAPRTLPTTGFGLVEHKQTEEETLLGYRADYFYPVRLGEVFQDRFQIVVKLGFGSSSTIWLARDLQDHRFVALKVCIHKTVEHRELLFHQHLDKALPSEHPGAKNIRHLLDSFQVAGPHGTHKVLVLQPSQMSIRDMNNMFTKGEGFGEDFGKDAIYELLNALDFLHTCVHCVHTDVYSSNLLLGAADDDSIFQGLVDAELSDPVERKQLNDRTVYRSRVMRPKAGPMLLSDFGEARLGPGPHRGHIMPIGLQAPEILLQLQWSYPVDIWSVGLMAWKLVQGQTLFTSHKDDGTFSAGVHLAGLIAALGPPPQQLLDWNRERSLEFWDENGTWREVVPIPVEKTLEAEEAKIGKENTLFLRFIRRTLTWDPNERPTARELLSDPWFAS